MAPRARVPVRSPEEVLIAHQRHGIEGCLCGWGAATGHLGMSHAAHVLRALEAERYEVVPEDEIHWLRRQATPGRRRRRWQR